MQSNVSKLLIRRIICIDLALFLLFLDQFTKWAITEKLLRPLSADAMSLGFLDWIIKAPERLSYSEIKVFSFFNLVMVWNEGVSFGLFNQGSELMPAILSASSLVIASIFIVWFFRSQSLMQSIAIVLVVSGAIGNVIDRLRFGAVIDFLDFHIYGHHWPAFNVADSCIVVGIFMLITYSLYLENTEKKQSEVRV